MAAHDGEGSTAEPAEPAETRDAYTVTVPFHRFTTVRQGRGAGGPLYGRWQAGRSIAVSGRGMRPTALSRSLAMPVTAVAPRRGYGPDALDLGRWRTALSRAARA
jgi:hypothetical protein